MNGFQYADLRKLKIKRDWLLGLSWFD